MRVALTLFLAVAVPAPGAAQEPPRRAAWTIGGELSLTELSGNKTLTLLTSGFNAKRVAPDGATLESQILARYGTSNGEIATENYRAELSARLRPSGRVSPSFRVAAQRDPQRNLDLRVAISAGAAISLTHRDDHDLQMGVALLADREYRRLPPESSLERQVAFTRFDFRIRARVPLRDAVTLEHQSVFQPVAETPTDYLLTTRSSVQVFLTRQLAFQTSYLLERDASPLPSVEFKNDRTLTAGILIRIRTGG
jgi:hypothetical protein